MNIEGLGEKIVDQLVDKEIVKDIAGLYALKIDDLSELERMGEKAAQNLLDEIEASRKNSLPRLIYALGIPFVGERTAQLLANRFSSVQELASAKEEELHEVEEVGPKVASGILGFFLEPANRQLIKKLEKAGVRPTTEKRTVKSNKLVGKSFVFTGGRPKRRRGGGGGILQEKCGKVVNLRSKEKELYVGEAESGA